MTGKVKEMFEKWYHKNYGTMWNTINVELNSQYREWDLSNFYSKPPAMQQGVYREFFEVNGVFFEHQRSEVAENEIEYAFMVLDGDTNLLAKVVKAPDYNAAFTQAIETACNILEGK